MSPCRKRIWIDLDNSPHVPFFVPIMNELVLEGHSVLLTVRDTFQVVGLAERYKLTYLKVGRHYGANNLWKVVGTVWRSLQLTPMVLRYKPDVSISHGSRSLILLSSLLRVPTILIFDYEFTKQIPVIKPILGIAPEVVAQSELAVVFKRGIRYYSGIKEDAYVPTFKPDPSILSQLGVVQDDLLITIRPPASEAHYHNPESDQLFLAVVEFLGSHPNVRMVILPRNEVTQKDLILRTWPQWVKEKKIIIPEQVVDGLNLIWHSDLVISGGGTMNREAAALGVPVYSIFRGTIGAVDRYLSEKGRLTLIESERDVKSKVVISKRVKSFSESCGERGVLEQIVRAIEEIVKD